jgi:hypothetical protein
VEAGPGAARAKGGHDTHFLFLKRRFCPTITHAFKVNGNFNKEDHDRE